jgi:hypothetical protein
LIAVSSVASAGRLRCATAWLAAAISSLVRRSLKQQQQQQQQQAETSSSRQQQQPCMSATISVRCMQTCKRNQDNRQLEE